MEELSKADQTNERLLTGLRTIWGCDIDEIYNEYGFDFMNEKKGLIDHLLKSGLARLDGTTLILTVKGWLIADKIVSDLMVV